MIYLSFLPKSSGWAVSLLWAMMILPLADALQNTMQNLVSRMAGVNNEELANRGIGKFNEIASAVSPRPARSEINHVAVVGRYERVAIESVAFG